MMGMRQYFTIEQFFFSFSSMDINIHLIFKESRYRDCEKGKLTQNEMKVMKMTLSILIFFNLISTEMCLLLIPHYNYQLNCFPPFFGLSYLKV